MCAAQELLLQHLAAGMGEIHGKPGSISFMSLKTDGADDNRHAAFFATGL